MAFSKDNTVFQKNLKLLKQYHPLAWDKLTVYTENGLHPELVTAQNGSPNIVVQKDGLSPVFIHDPQNPGKEAAPFMDHVAQDFQGTLLVFGMGLGYLVRALVTQRPNFQHLVIFELDIEIFKLTMSVMDLEPVLTDHRVILSLAEVADVSALLHPAKRSLMLEDIHTHKLLTCFQVNDKYEDLASVVFDNVSAFNIDGATRSHHGKTFIENRLRHLTAMHHDRKLEDLADRFKGVPALMVAAGPSLDKNIDEIKRAVGKAVIIAVDTALPALLDHGITPDFVTSIDYNDPIYEKIAAVASQPVARELNLICTSWVACTVTKVFPAKTIYWAFGNNAFENWMNGLLGGKLAITGAGTVAHLNYAAAMVMGCDPLIFVGQDLAHSYDREHASKVVFTGTETMDKILKDAIWVKGVNTDQVPTTRSLHGYRVLFEQWIAGAKETVINATEGGAWMKGAKHMPLAQAIDQFCQKDVDWGDLVQKGGERTGSIKGPMEAMIKRILRAEKTVKRAEKLGTAVLQGVRQLQKDNKRILSLPMVPNKLRNQILELDKCHNTLDLDNLWGMFDEMTMTDLKENERAKREIDRLEGTPEHYLEWVAVSVERLNRVNAIRKKNLMGFKAQLSDLMAFHEGEKRLNSRIRKSEGDPRYLLELARLYYGNGDYVLLFDLMEGSQDREMSYPEIHFYYGVIFLYRGDYEKAKHHFSRCLELDSGFAVTIEKKRRAMADYYYEWGKTLPLKSLHELSDKSGIYLRDKGLKMFPGHEGILGEFKTLAEKELTRLNQGVQEKGAGFLSENAACLKAWVEFFQDDGPATVQIPKTTQIGFIQFHGKVLLDAGDAAAALALYQEALGRMPDSPELSISAADVCFGDNDFSRGLDYLRAAVALDRRYAIYWYNMGNNLMGRGDFSGALLAFEEHLEALPGRTEIWKLIGDCHTRLGNAGAAQNAYQTYEASKP